MVGLGADPGPDPELSARCFESCARQTRPERSCRIVVGTLRRAFPSARVDLLQREGERTWQTIVQAPVDERRLEPWPPPPPPQGQEAEAERNWTKPLPPREPTHRELVEDQHEHPGDAELASGGYRWRILLPLRGKGVRAALSVSRRDVRFSDQDIEFVAAVAACLVPALTVLAEARGAERRLERARRHADRARFVQRLTAGLQRSLAVKDVFRAVTERLVRLVPFARSWLMLSPEDGSDLVVSSLDDGDGFRRVLTTKVQASGSLLARFEEKKELESQVTLAEIETPSPLQQSLIDAGHHYYVLLPLLCRGRAVGLLGLSAREVSVLEGEALSLLRHVAGPLAVAVENARLYHQAQERSKLMTALHEVGLALGSTEDRKDLTEAVLSILHESFDFQHSAVLQLTDGPDGQELVMLASRGYSRRKGGALRIPLGDKGITSEAARTGKLVHVADVRADERYIKGVHSGRSEVAIPLIGGDQVLGVLDVESTEVNGFSTDDLEALKLFSTQASLALRRAMVFEEIRQQARTDGLTGLLNQRYFHQKLERELLRSERTHRSFTLALLDLDGLKGINDQLGHVEGNRAIVAVGGALQARVRAIDAAARFGGDEIALVLSETHTEGALTTVQRHQSDQQRRTAPLQAVVTVSIGLAEWRPEFESVAQVIEAADEALYRAKSTGKNRTCVAGD
jgi:diguanylate cyclase (GGDEF)-like protein